MHNHKNETFADKILERIEAGQVRPRPKSYFSLKNITIWTLAVLSVLVGGLSVSSIIFRTVNVPAVLPPGMMLAVPLMVRLAPVLWILLFSLFSFLAYREIRATRKGYKYELSTILLALMLGSVVLGIGFYATGLGARLDHFAERHVPFVGKLDEEQRERWMRPEHGFLIGTVVSVETDRFTLKDPHNTLWTVLIDEEVSTTSLSAGTRVGVRGTVETATSTFTACDLRSLEFSGERKPPFPRVLMDERERNSDGTRTKECEGVRPPYQAN